MNQVELYYKLVKGIMPEESVINQTEKVVKHLIDNNIDDKNILATLLIIGKSGAIYPNDLPDSLWDNSLIDRTKFYYHNELHITSKPPKWNPATLKETVEPFFLEMKILYTIDNLLDYFYKLIRTPMELRDYKKDIGALNHLLNKYSKMKVEALDFVLTLIDIAATSEEERILNVLDLSKLERDAYDYYETLIPMATHEKANQIIWR